MGDKDSCTTENNLQIQSNAHYHSSDFPSTESEKLF